jgi:hypothetical protein
MVQRKLLFSPKEDYKYLVAIEDPKPLDSLGKISALMLQASGPNPIEKKKM